MPCDTVQLNELNMLALDLDILAKSLEKDGWQNVYIDRQTKRVVASGFEYIQATGSLTYNIQRIPRSLKWFANLGEDSLEKEIKRSYIWEMMKTRVKSLPGWEFTFDKQTGKGKLRKRVGTGYGSQFGKSEDKGGFSGFCWGKH
jgi:hypothetical protein